MSIEKTYPPGAQILISTPNRRIPICEGLQVRTESSAGGQILEKVAALSAWECYFLQPALAVGVVARFAGMREQAAGDVS